jgi:hypothetical protein
MEVPHHENHICKIWQGLARSGVGGGRACRGWLRRLTGGVRFEVALVGPHHVSGIEQRIQLGRRFEFRREFGRSFQLQQRLELRRQLQRRQLLRR